MFNKGYYVKYYTINTTNEGKNIKYTPNRYII